MPSKVSSIYFPTTLVYASCFSGVALGIARGSLDDLIRLAQTKVQRAARSSLRESPVFQSQLAELEAKWGACKGLPTSYTHRNYG